MDLDGGSLQQGRRHPHSQRMNRSGRNVRCRSRVGERGPRGYSRHRLFAGISWYVLGALASRMVHDQDGI